MVESPTLIINALLSSPDGGIHAREWISPATVSGILRDIVENSNTSYSSLLSSLDIYLLPLVNPDGYEYSRTKDRLWRKVRIQTGWASPAHSWA